MIGVKLSEARVRAARVVNSHVRASHSVPFARGASSDEILSAIVSAIGVIDTAPRGVGIAIPGGVDSDGRCWRMLNLAALEGVHVGRELNARIGCPVAVENDATAAAFAERLHGAGREHLNFFMVMLRAGVGGGFVFGGELYRGKQGFAGEFGHITVDVSQDATRCVCGQRGCVEAYAGAKSMLRKYRELGGVASDVSAIVDNARHGDHAALETLYSVSDALGAGLATIQNVLDLSAIVFCSNTNGLLHMLERQIRTKLRSLVFGDPAGEVAFLESKLGDDAEVIGAAELFRPAGVKIA
jgi:predicted NBD/HSP70 family sugar kinase